MLDTRTDSRFEIVAREDFSDVTFLLEIRHPLLAKAAQPGQFVIVMSHAEGERIPLTIADFDRGKGTITLVIQAVGKTTKEMQQNCVVGTHLYAVTGPMGIPSRFDKVKKVACVGGGLGVAPIYPHARAFKEAGAYVIGVIGFRNWKLMFWEDKFRGCCDELIVCTDDGSVGVKGPVTEGIKRAIAAHQDIDEVIAIGPPVMMKACVDGPDFDGHQVDFDDLVTRLRRFTTEEKTATERWSENCRMQNPMRALHPLSPALVAPDVVLPDPFDEVVGG